MTQTKAVFIGSFNPLHLGHMDIINQCYDIFGKENVLIYSAVNPAKFTELNQGEVLNKISLIEQKMKEYSSIINHQILPLGLISTATLMRELDEIHDRVVLVRGLRDTNDYQYEEKTVTYLRKLYPKIKVVYLSSSEQYRHISSSDIRNMESSGMPDLIEYANQLKVKRNEN